MTMQAATDNLLQKSSNDIFKIIDSAISIAASRWPEDFLARRNQIAKKLYDAALLASDASNSMTGSFGGKCNVAAREEADKNEVLATDNKKKGRHVVRIKLPVNLKKPKVQSDNVPAMVAVQESILCRGTDQAKVGQESAGQIVQEGNFVQAKLVDEEELLQKKLEDSERKLQERYKKIQGSRKRILVVELKDAPKPPVDPKKPRIHYAR